MYSSKKSKRRSGHSPRGTFSRKNTCGATLGGKERRVYPSEKVRGGGFGLCPNPEDIFKGNGGKERRLYLPRKVKEEDFDIVKIRGTFSREI